MQPDQINYVGVAVVETFAIAALYLGVRFAGWLADLPDRPETHKRQNNALHNKSTPK